MSFLKYPGMSESEIAVMTQQAMIEESRQHQLNLQRAEEAVLEKRKSDAENEKLVEWHRQDSERKRQAEAEENRKIAAENFEQDLRRKFFEANGFASESDFQKILPKLREQTMIDKINSSDKSEKLTLESGNYSAM